MKEKSLQGAARESEDSGILRIARQGVFSAGGTVTEPVEGEYDPVLGWTDPKRAGNTAHVDHANVFYQIPDEDNGHPIVYLHGHGQSRVCWQFTPDGREGWSDLFLKMGHAAFLVDQPRRGAAGAATELPQGAMDVFEGTNKYKAGDQAMYTHFRIGRVPPERYEGSQFPEGEQVLDQFFREMTPNTGDFNGAACMQAMGAVMEEVREMTGNKSIYITHSQGGMIGWATPAANIAAIIAIEPGGVPQTGSPQYKALLNAKIPIAIYFGDYIDNGPQELASTGIWKTMRDNARAFAEQFNADGGDCTVFNLPDEGITGNSHFMFQELNNAEIACHIEAWLRARGLAD
ncbi:MAG: alpha/beta fold hydrolase [Eubacteriales bacterium]|nr:alpha/beta fold hydrolase [Eubacteriales bacterium]